MKRRNPQPQIKPKFQPKFQPGQRVRISPTGVANLIHEPGTTGIVAPSQFQHVVLVILDGHEIGGPYSPDYWEATE